MAITLDINAIRENEDDQTVYFTATAGVKSYEWHADTPKLTEAETRDYLIEHKDRLVELLQGKIDSEQGFKSTHPKWVKAEKMIDDISNLADVKVFLKKIVRYIT